MMKLNLGSGNDVKEGWINCDYFVERPDVMKVDLNNLPLPFEDNSADEIMLSHTLEHMRNQYELVMDCHRILKKGGILHIKLPIHANRLEHVSFYHQKNYFQTLYRNPSQNYGHDEFELVSIKKRVFPCRARVRDRYYRLLSWLHSLVYLEYYWRLRKK